MPDEIDEERRFDPWSYPRAQYPTDEFKMTDPALPDVAPFFRLQKLGPTERGAAQDRAEQFIQEYIEGDPEFQLSDGKSGRKPGVYQSRDDSPVPMSRRFILDACFIERMQRQKVRYDFDGLVGWSTRMKDGYEELERRANALQGGRVIDTEAEGGNSTGASSAPAPALGLTSSAAGGSIPSSQPDSTPRSAPLLTVAGSN